jgi:hypothetical protein
MQIGCLCANDTTEENKNKISLEYRRQCTYRVGTTDNLLVSVRVVLTIPYTLVR